MPKEDEFGDSGPKDPVGASSADIALILHVISFSLRKSLSAENTVPFKFCTIEILILRRFPVMIRCDWYENNDASQYR